MKSAIVPSPPVAGTILAGYRLLRRDLNLAYRHLQVS